MKTFLGVLSTLLFLVIVYMFFTNKSNSGAGNGTVVSDTIYIQHTDTIIKEKLKPYAVYVDKIITDTLLSIDSIPIAVNIPISNNQYNDTIVNNSSDSVIINSSISGYKVSFDSINVVFKVKERVVTNTINPKLRRFKVGPSVGIQYNGKSIQPFVGFGITYSLFSF